jgi:hypothetical protein
LQKIAELKNEWESRRQHIEKELAIVRGPRRERQPAKQSYAELADLPGMRIEQIAKMKMVSVEKVREELLRLGHPKGGDYYAPIDEAQKRREEIARRDPHDECGDDLEARIRACREDGWSPKSISETLTHFLGKTVTLQKIVTVLQEAESAA